MQEIIDGLSLPFSLVESIGESENVLVRNYGSDALDFLYDERGFEELYESLDDESFFLNLQNSSGLDSIQKNAIIGVFEELAAYDGSNSCAVLEKLKESEVEILDNVSHAEDVEVFLMASSIARHSLIFWDNLDVEIEELAKFKNWNWRLIAVISCDVAGGIAGCLAGLPTVAGGVCGAIVGGVSGSASCASLINNWPQ